MSVLPKLSDEEIAQANNRSVNRRKGTGNEALGDVVEEVDAEGKPVRMRKLLDGSLYMIKDEPSKLTVEAWIDNEVAEMSELIEGSPNVERYIDPKTKKALPIYLSKFKCRYCDEELTHLTDDWMREEDKKKRVICYAEHLKKKHGDIFNATDQTVKSPDRIRLDQAMAENEELKQKLNAVLEAQNKEP
jgi:hypothetical protein